MDIGVISTRYARALLKSAGKEGVDDAVYRDMVTMAKSYIDVPALRHTIAAPMIAKDTKKYKGKHIDDVDDTEIPVVKNAKRGVLHIPMEDPNHTDW